MAKRMLAIGLGETGKWALTFLKERLIETYGSVPTEVILLSFDTDVLQDTDCFMGVRLDTSPPGKRRPAEFQCVSRPSGMTMRAAFADITSGTTKPYMHWLEKDKLDRFLGPADRDIEGGVQRWRPISRTALFLRWAEPIYESICNAIACLYARFEEEEKAIEAQDIERGKPLIFVVSSVAGSTGSGFLIDIANLVRHATSSQERWQSTSVSATIVLPSAFSNHPNLVGGLECSRVNCHATLRELDRFMRVHSTYLPYMIRYGEDEKAITWNTNQLFDHVYLVDTASRSTSQASSLEGNPFTEIFPMMADFLLAHVDQSLGDALSTLRSNAGQHYDKPSGRVYSGFSIMSYVFPIDDIVTSFSYRFLREILARQFLSPSSEVKAIIEQQAQGEVACRFVENSISGRTNPTLVQKALACTRSIEPERPDVSWSGLLNLVALSDGEFVEDYQDLNQSITYLVDRLIPSKEGEYKREDFADGFTRLLNFSNHFMDEFLGPQVDPDDEESRCGGDWDRILERHRDALRNQFDRVVEAMLIGVLSRRDRNQVLEPSGITYAQCVVRTLKDHLGHFKSLLEEYYREQKTEAHMCEVSQGLRDAIVFMRQTKFDAPRLGFVKSDARKAQEQYIRLFVQKMELTLDRLVYCQVLNILDAMGASEHDSTGQPSVLDTVAKELEYWQITMQNVDLIIHERSEKHKANRNQKQRIRVRHYLTDPEFEDELYRQPMCFGAVAQRVLGLVRGQQGLMWQRENSSLSLSFKLVSIWGEHQSKDASSIAQCWFTGIKSLFQSLRDKVTMADRIATRFSSSQGFAFKATLLEEPFLLYNPSRNDGPMYRERYVSMNFEKVHDGSSRDFLLRAQRIVLERGVNLDTKAESSISCTAVAISRGVRLAAVHQYGRCRSEYRAKLDQDEGNIHIFPEEQIAASYERIIHTLGEADNQERALAPELVVAMGNVVKLRTFVLACAYQLIDQALYYDQESGQESTEVVLNLPDDDSERRLLLSQSQIPRRLEPSFSRLPARSQVGRLYLDALQNFALKITEIPGVMPQAVFSLRHQLQRRGVSVIDVHRLCTLPLSRVNDALRRKVGELGPTVDEEPDPTKRESLNAQRRLRVLEPYLAEQVQYLKRSQDSRLKDLGTVMHLILREEINQLREIARKVQGKPAIFEDSYQFFVKASLAIDVASDTDFILRPRPAEDHPSSPKKDEYTADVVPRSLRSESHMALFERDAYARIISGRPPTADDFEEVSNAMHVRYGDDLAHYLAFVVYDQFPALADRYRLYEIRQRDGLAIILLGAERFAQVGSDRSAYDILHTEINRVRGKENLYKITSPVSDDLSFFGRERPLQEIVDLLDAGHPMGLFGLRKVGKTSLVMRLRDRLSRRRVISFVDTQQTARSQGIWPLYPLIIEGFARHILKYRQAVVLPDLHLWPDDRSFWSDERRSVPAMAQGFMEDLNALYTALGSKDRLLLIVDETDRLLPAGDDPPYEGFMSLFSQLRTANQVLGILDLLVVAGDASLNRVERWGERSNEFYQVLQEMWMPRMESDAAQDMIESLGLMMGFDYQKEPRSALKQVVEAGGGHPLLTRHLCVHAVEEGWQSGQTTISDEQAQSSIENYIRRHDSYLAELWQNQLSESQKDILRSLARSNIAVSLENLLPATKRQVITAALGALEERTLIHCEANGYHAIGWGALRSYVRWVELGLPIERDP